MVSTRRIAFSKSLVILIVLCALCSKVTLFSSTSSLPCVYAFVAPRTRHTPRADNQVALNLNIGGWFGRNRKKRQDNDAENLGGVASIVDSLGDLKTAQRVGQLTDSLVKELSSTVVEGSAVDGKVKVTFNCQQKPVGVTIDEGFMSEVDATTLSNAVSTAMQDAHSKSIERMDEKMKSLYAELGLSPATV